MARTTVEKRRSRKAYKAALALLSVLIAGMIAFDAYLVCYINGKKALCDEYIRQANAVSAVKNFDEKTKELYNSVTEKKSLVQALKTTLAARENRLAELKAEAPDKYNIAAEAEARKVQFANECGYSTYEALLAAYNNLLTEN